MLLVEKVSLQSHMHTHNMHRGPKTHKIKHIWSEGRDLMDEWHEKTFEGGVITAQLPPTTANDSDLLCPFSQTDGVQKYTNRVQMIH